MLLDIDHFKRCKRIVGIFPGRSVYGSDIETPRVVCAFQRPDYAFEGDEFAILLQDLTDAEK